MADDKATPEGQRLIEGWLAALERVAQAKRELSHAECGVSNAQKDLAKWMLPDDAEPGEKIAIWHGDSMIQVEVPLQSHMPAPIVVRKRGRALRAA